MNGDFASAIALLIPQLEHCIRAKLKTLGIHTLLVDDRGVETEKSLGTLLELLETAETFGADVTLELRALLTERTGANLRNTFAHGLMDDTMSMSYFAAYAWWLCLRLTVVPLWHISSDGSGNAEDEAGR